MAKDKKVYFGDPLLSTITAARVGLSRDRPAEVENALALALYRRYEPLERSAENMGAPEALHVWGTQSWEVRSTLSAARAGRSTRRGGRLGHARPPQSDRAWLGPCRAALPWSQAADELDFGKSANVVPAALLLWSLSG